MTRQPTCSGCCQTFAESYEISNLPAMRELERHVLGCDYGGTSWTTRAQAAQIVETLALRPHFRLLELGAGSGWPGLYVAEASGCSITLLDLPVSALTKARARARRDGIADRVAAVAASGDALPFRDAQFDAVSHSDVLCCLPNKTEMLSECRRVVAEGGRMLFSVIAVPDGLTQSERQQAIELGPPFIDATAPYRDLLADTGWDVTNHDDVTADYARSLRRLVLGLNESDALVEALGEEAVVESIRHRQAQIDGVERGLLIREIFVVTAMRSR